MGIGEVGDILFVCPPFFGLKDAYAMPMPVFCPDVDTNQFVANPGKHQFPLDKSIALTRAVAFYYGIKENATRYGSVIEAQNDILQGTRRQLPSIWTVTFVFLNVGVFWIHSPILSRSVFVTYK